MQLKDKCGGSVAVTQTGLREEEESRCSAGDGLHVFFIIAAIVTRQQVVEDAHDAHQEQEGDDAFSKQVAGGAAKEICKKTWVRQRPANTRRTNWAVCLPLRGLAHVSDEVLLPDNKIDDPSKGSRSFRQMTEKAKKNTEPWRDLFHHTLYGQKYMDTPVCFWFWAVFDDFLQLKSNLQVDFVFS